MPSTGKGSDTVGVGGRAWGKNPSRDDGGNKFNSGVDAGAKQHSLAPSFAEIMAEQLQEAEVDEAFRKSGVLAIDDDLSTCCSELGLSHITMDEAEADGLNCTKDYELALFLSRDPDCSADGELAERLQREFDRETELSVKFTHSREVRGVASASLSSDPYRYMCDADGGGSSGEEGGGDEDDLREFATLLYERRERDFPPCGFIRNSDGAIVTKHDRELCGRKNCGKAMHLPLGLATGDVLGEGGQLFSDKVLSDLRFCSKVEAKRHVRIKDKEEKATSTSSVDAVTRLILFKWINSGEFDAVEGVIATGKESVVLHATARAGRPADGNGEEESNAATTVDEAPAARSETGGGAHYAIKVYKTSLASFKNRAEYVKDDFRFKNPRRVMKIWAEREFMNLQRLKRASVPCPMVMRLKKHVLLMSLIGVEGCPAPRLKEVEWMSQQEILMAFLQVKEIVKRMFNECRLVHADLSEFNLLYANKAVYVIDVAQAMDVSHPKALIYLYRDIHNVLEFFTRLGVAPALPSEHEFYTDITGIDFDRSDNLLVQVETFGRENRNVNTRMDKSRPADMEMRLYSEDLKEGGSSSSSGAERAHSPAGAYN